MKKKLIYVVACLGCVQLANQPLGYGQSQKPTDLNEIVVTASRSYKKQSEIGKVVRIISKEEIEKSRGRTLPELLNTVPGLTIGGAGSNPGNLMSVFLRGASSGNTLITIDGIAVNDASSTSGEFTINSIVIDQIERIEILKGGNSTLYGSDAVAGVINIITKKGNGPIQGNLLLSAGNYNTFKQAVGLSGSVGKNNFSINLTNNNSKSISTAEPFNDNVEFERDKFAQKSVGINFNSTITKKISIIGSTIYSNTKSDFDNGAFLDASNNFYNKNAYLINIGSAINLGNGNLKFNVSQNNVRNKFSYDDSKVDNKGNIFNIESIFTSSVSKSIDITSGINSKFAKTDQRSDFSTLSSDSSKNNISSFYTSIFINKDKIFNLEIGGRYNYHNQFGNNFNYTINPSLNFNDKIKIFFNASSAYKVPTLYQLTSEYKNADGLNPESSNTLETGVDFNFMQNKINLNASLYRRKIDDVIVFGAQNNGGFGYLNQDIEKTRGFEIEIGAKLIKNINFSAYYAFTEGNILSNNSTLVSLSRRPKNSFGSSVGVDINKNFYINLIYKYTGERADSYYDSNFELLDTKLKGFHKFDIYTKYNLKSNFNLFIDAKNIFDVKYNDFIGFSAMRANFNAGLSITFK